MVKKKRLLFLRRSSADRFDSPENLERIAVDDFPVQGRGGQGVIAIQTSDRNGKTVGALQVADEDEVMLISSNGTLVRTGVDDISIMGRNTQGVRLIRVEKGQRLVGLARIEAIEEEED